MPAVSHLDLLWVGALAALLLGMGSRRAVWPALVCAGALLASGLLAAARLPMALAPPEMLSGDSAAAWSTLLLCMAAALCLVLIPETRGRPAPAGYALVTLATFGAVLLATAVDLTGMLLGLVLVWLGTVPLAAGTGGPGRSLVAFAATTSGVIAFGYGAVLLYGISGTTDLTVLPELLRRYSAPLLWTAGGLCLLGLGVVAALAPLHLWLTRQADRMPPAGAAFITVVPKLAALLALHRLAGVFDQGGVAASAALGALAALAMTWGNLAALRARDLQRLLACSATAQAGYMLAGIAAMDARPALPALLYYASAFALAHVGAVAALTASGCRRQGDQQGLFAVRPGAAIALLLALLSLAAVPPLAGFIGRFALLAATMEGGGRWLVALMIVNTLIGLFYYLRVGLPMFLASERRPMPSASGSAVTWLALACAVGSVGVGVAGSTMLADFSRALLSG